MRACSSKMGFLFTVILIGMVLLWMSARHFRAPEKIIEISPEQIEDSESDHTWREFENNKSPKNKSSHAIGIRGDRSKDDRTVLDKLSYPRTVGSSQNRNEMASRSESLREMLDKGGALELDFHVVNPCGVPVSNAQISVEYTFPVRGWCESWEDHHKRTSAGTDESGYCRMEISPNSMVYWFARAEGYYNASGDLSLDIFASEEGARLRRWFPEPIPVLLEMNPIQKPHSMDRRMVYVSMPSRNREFAYDLQKCDFLPPDGHGVVTDVVFRYDLGPLPGRHSWSRIENSRRFSIRFPGKHNGGIFVPLQDQSLPCGLYEAPDLGYCPEFQAVLERTEDKILREELFGNSILVFRIRSESASDGTLKSAVYGKIRGNLWPEGEDGQFMMCRWINSEPNDKGMENEDALPVGNGSWMFVP